jgi:hypothetical protein
MLCGIMLYERNKFETKFENIIGREACDTDHLKHICDLALMHVIFIIFFPEMKYPPPCLFHYQPFLKFV